MSHRLKMRKIDRLERRRNGIVDASYNLYRSLQVLHKVYNNCYSGVIAWMLAAAMNLIVISFTVTMRVVPQAMTNLQFPAGAIVMLIVMRYVIQPLADFPSASQEFSTNYCHGWGLGRAVRRRQRRSMRQFEAKCSMFFVIRRETLLEFWSQAANNTVTLLLMT